MIWSTLKSRVLGGVARWLGRWAGFLRRQAGFWNTLAQRSQQAAEVQEPADPDKPPAHWLARLEEADQSLQWMTYRAPPAPRIPARRQPQPRWPSSPARSAPAPTGGAPVVEAPGDEPRVQQAGSTGRDEIRAEAERIPPPRAPVQPQIAPTSQRATHPPKRLIARPKPPEPGIETSGEDEQPQPSPPQQVAAPVARASEAESPAVEDTPPAPRRKPRLRKRKDEAEPAMTATDRPEREGVATPHAPSQPDAQSRPAAIQSGPIFQVGGVKQREDVPGDHELSSPPPRERPKLVPHPFEPTPPGGKPPASPPRDATRRSETGSGASQVVPPSPRSEPTERWGPVPRFETQRPAPAPEPQWDEETAQDRWPALPERSFPTANAEDTLTDEDWEARYRRRQRIQRLDEEQKGNPWNASPF